MFKALGVNWAGTLLGFVALALVPIPVVFWKFGARIRARSQFAPTMPKNMPGVSGAAVAAGDSSEGSRDVEKQE